jgi:hypothetical protein
MDHGAVVHNQRDVARDAIGVGRREAERWRCEIARQCIDSILESVDVLPISFN